MPPSPSKRRKTSPTTSVAVADPYEFTSTTTRASYQSPTKASLSRSHPTILAQSPGRRLSEGRGKSLRQEVMLGKTNAPTTADEPSIQAPRENNNQEKGQGDDNFSSRLRAVGSTQVAQSDRSPLRPRQPSVREYNFPMAQNSDAEPELPPTPTQLGMSPKPGPPRGLAASSSPSTRGPRRTRLRSGQVEASSPLKPRNNVAGTRAALAVGDVTDDEVADEAPTSEVEQEERESEGELEGDDYEIQAKRREQDRLKAQLANLQFETARLEGALNGGEDEQDHLDSDLLSLLTTPNLSCDPRFEDSNIHPCPTTPNNPIAIDINPLAFLRAFAPGDLRLNTVTKSSSIRGKLHQVHVLTISAPPPWPTHIFTATFRLNCGIESQRIISITGVQICPRHGAGIKELRHWLEARLKNPLHRFDVGTIIWGLGMWFKEAVSRAKLFHHIDITKAGIDKTKLLPPFNPSQTLKSTEDIQPLLPYLGKSFLELIPAEPYSNRASTNEARKYRQPRLLLKWDLDLDWAGEVHTEIDVAGTKISAQGAEGLRTVFAELRRRKGLERAVAEVLELCTGDVNRSSKKRKGE